MMLRALFLLLMFNVFVFASSELAYTNKDKNLLQELVSKKTTHLSENIVFNLDLMSAYQLLSENDQNSEFFNTLQNKNPDKVLFTFSYKF